MAIKVITIEGATAEQGGLPGEATTDVTQLGLDFEVETPAVYTGEPRIARLLVVEAQTEGQTLTPAVVADNTATTLTTTISTAAGTKSRVEIPIAITGSVFSVRLTASDLTKRIEVSRVELDFDGR